MIACVKCGNVENIVRSGFVRGKQRLYCKACELYFSISPPNQPVSKKQHQTTIIDIAKALGVSPSTVSRALNNSSEINENTRQEIIRVANELDYRPNLLAQSLHRGETHTIGVVIPDIQRPFFCRSCGGHSKSSLRSRLSGNDLPVERIAQYRNIECASIGCESG